MTPGPPNLWSTASHGQTSHSPGSANEDPVLQLCDSPLSSDLLEIGDGPRGSGVVGGLASAASMGGGGCAYARPQLVWTHFVQQDSGRLTSATWPWSSEAANRRPLDVSVRQAGCEKQRGGWPCRAPQGTGGEPRCACPCSDSQVSRIPHNTSWLQAPLLTGGDPVQTDHTPPPPARKRAPSLLPGVKARPRTNVTNVQYHYNGRETAHGRSHSEMGGRRAPPDLPSSHRPVKLGEGKELHPCFPKNRLQR